MPQAAAFRRNPCQCAPVTGASARRTQSQVDLGLDDCKGRAQLVRRVRGELELAPAGLLQWAIRHKPDRESPEKHGEDVRWAGDGLSPPDHSLHVLSLSQAFTGHQPS